MDEANQQLWRELERVLRLDEPPLAALGRAHGGAERLRRAAERRFDAIELRGVEPN